MSTLTATQLQQQYIAYFGRPGDPAGIKYWLSSTSGISTAREFADKIYAQDEYKNSTVGDKSTEAQVNSLYQNLFGREADASGLIYWTGQIEAGILTLSNIAYDLIAAASNPVSGNETQGAADALALSNKVAAAEAFTADIEASTSAILAYQPESTDPWKTGTAFESGASFISGITTTAHTDAGVDTGIAAMITASSTGSGSSAVGSTLKFTTSTDALVGDSLNDTINGVLQTGGGTGTTIAPGDSVDGKGGTDTVQISVAGLNGANNATHTLSAVTTDNVEKFVLSNFETGSGVNNVETGLMTGLTTVGLSASSSSGGTAFTKLPNFVDAEMRNGSADLTLTYNGVQVVTGTDDTQNLLLAAQTAGTFTVNSVETVNIDSKVSKNTLTALTADTLKTLNITGDTELVLTTVTGYAGTPTNGVAIDATIDASAFTGKFTSDLGNEAATLDVKGGTNDDVIQLGATLTVNDKIDTGAGTDRVEITGASIGTALKFTDRTLTNVETIRLTSTAGTALSVDADGDSLTRYEVVQNATNNISATVNNIAPGDTVAFLGGTDDEDGNAYTVSLKDASGSSDIGNLEILGVTALDAESVAATLTFADVETINIKSGTHGTTAMLAASDSNVLTSGVFNAATSLNATGDANFTISGLTAANLLDVDASALAAKFVITAPALGTAAKPFSITGGAFDDTFTMGTTLSTYDTIKGGGDSTTTGDTLTATIANLGDVVTYSKLNIADVENIHIISSGSNYIDGSGITGASKVKLGTANTTTTTVKATGLPAGLTYLLGDLDANDEFKGTVDLSLADETGTADTIAIETTVTGSNDDITATIKLSDGIETLSIKHNDDDTADADANFTVSDAKVDKIVVTEGTAAELLKLGQLHVNTTTIDASNFIGSLTLTAGSGNTTVTKKTARTTDVIAFGSGDDTYTVTGSATITEDAGAGTDVLNYTLDGDITEDSNNFETVNYGVGANAQVTVTAADGEGVDTATTFKVTGGDGLSTFTIATIHSPASLTTIDYSTFLGSTTSTTFAADKVVNTMTITGSAGTDTLVTSGSSVAVSSMTGVETLTINAATNMTFDASKASGLKQINVDDDNTAETITLNKLEDSTIVQITSENASSVYVLDQANKSGADNSISVEVGGVAAGTNIDIADVETINLKNETSDSSVSLDGLAMATAGKRNKLVVTGDKALTVSAHHVDTTVIDASGMTTGGAYIMTGRADTSTAIDFTGSIGNDTFIFNVAGDIAKAGAGTGDTLTVTGAGVIGGFSIDLTQADQMSLYEGNPNPSIQSGFEHVNLDAITGPYGSFVIGSSAANTITGSDFVDSFTPGEGADIVTGGIGADIIDFTESTSSVDKAIFSAAASNGVDVITGFVPGTDKINIEVLGSGNLGATAVDAAANAASVDLADTAAIVFANMADLTGATTITAGTVPTAAVVATALNAILTQASNDDHAFVFNDPSVNKAYVYSGATANDTWATGDITHVGTITTTGAVITSADLEYTI